MKIAKNGLYFDDKILFDVEFASEIIYYQNLEGIVATKNIPNDNIIIANLLAISQEFYDERDLMEHKLKCLFEANPNIVAIKCSQDKIFGFKIKEIYIKK